jgi:hypothetical protein
MNFYVHILKPFQLRSICMQSLAEMSCNHAQSFTELSCNTAQHFSFNTQATSCSILLQQLTALSNSTL